VLALVSSVASAQAPLGWTGDGASALPAVRRVGVPASTREAVSVSAEGGYAWTEPVAWNDGEHHRAYGSLAASVRPWPWLAFWLRADGRYDRHIADERGPDDGVQGLPRLGARLGATVDPRVALGLELELSAPGSDAPSFDARSLSLEARALASFQPIPHLTLATMAGFRLDNSGATVPRPVPYRLGDHVALGASDYHAVLLGVGVVGAITPIELFAELTMDLLLDIARPVGADDPGPSFPHPLRTSAGARWHVAREVAIELGAELFVTPNRPEVSRYKALLPIEPRITAYAAVRLAFPWNEPTPIVEEPAPVEAPETIDEPAPIEPALATLRGRVVDEDGEPIPSARVTLVRGDETRTVESDPEGAFELRQVPPGPATLRIEADGRDPFERTVEVGEGEQALESATLARSVPRGQLRGMIRSYDGRPLVARILVEDLQLNATTDEEGFFELDVPPGEHIVIVEADGHRSQRRTVDVPENGVTVLNADLRRGRAR
jgi:hypothetical protein